MLINDPLSPVLFSFLITVVTEIVLFPCGNSSIDIYSDIRLSDTKFAERVLLAGLRDNVAVKHVFLTFEV